MSSYRRGKRRTATGGLSAPRSYREFFVDATNGNDANPGRQMAQAWQTVGQVNGETFRPTDHILVNRGDEFRENLIPPNSGIAGALITFSVYGTGGRPILNGTDLITGWAAEGTPDVWEATVTTSPNVVFMDDTVGDPQPNIPALVNEYDWYWNANTLYIYAATDPDARYTSPGVESGAREVTVNLNGLSYVCLDKLHLTKADTWGLKASNAIAEAGLNLRNLTVDWCYESGIFIRGQNNMTLSRISSSNALAEHGLYVSGAGGGVDTILIDRCQFYSNGTHGIQFNPNDVSRIVDPTIQYCHIYGNVAAEVNDSGTSGAKYHYNIIRNAGTATNCLSLNWTVDATYAAINAEVYNNTFIVSAGGGGLNVSFYNIGHVASNNIIHCPNTAARLVAVAISGADEGDLTSDYNVFYLTAPANVFNWLGNWSNSLAGWQADSSQDSNSDGTDPLFVNLANDWHLQSGSPARNSGTNVGLLSDYDGVPVPQETNPAMGPYEYVA